MPTITRIVKPGRRRGEVLLEDGTSLIIPENWALLEPGDGPLTKRVKAKGPSWTVQVKKGRRLISKGVWSAEAHIEEAKKEIETARSAPGYGKKRQADLARRERQHREYVAEFAHQVRLYLSFAPQYKELEKQLAAAVSDHATPVGSGTVARTKRIPVEERAARAVVAWLRHQTTCYDNMKIARVKGRRREVRRELAAISVKLLELYRSGEEVADTCPLQQALSKKHESLTP